jgi:6-pyruvoyltetrahydropterin/6-carboxytetrahydropterin synthase
VAEDDPELTTFKYLRDNGIIQLRIVPSTGCEAMAKMVFDATEVWLIDNGYAPRVRLVSVEAREHGGNSALWRA